MNSSEILALLFLYNAAVEGGKYAGPKFIEGVGQLLKKLGWRIAHKFRMGNLPTAEGDVRTISELQKRVESNIASFSSLDRAKLRQRVTQCLASSFSADEMKGPLKVMLSGYIATPSLDPNVVAVELYDLARRENRVHFLIDAMMKYQGREGPVRECLLGKDG